jgi:predicted 2-oxoglutarate/Fe(II)-dependent dioxygenase YbiX
MKYSYWYFQNLFNKNKISEINKYIEKNFDCFEPTELAAKTLDNKQKKFISSCKQIYWKKIKNLLEDFNQLVLKTNEENFGYNLYNLKDLAYINYNTYTENNKDYYNWHIDSSVNPLMDIKLTALINLSPSKYEGGKFLLFDYGDEYHVDKFDEPGSALIFKSNINHKVTPITKGKRITLTLFFCGPNFK